MNYLAAIPVIKQIIKFLTAPVLLKERDKEISRLRRRLKKLEKIV